MRDNFSSYYSIYVLFSILFYFISPSISPSLVKKKVVNINEENASTRCECGHKKRTAWKLMRTQEIYYARTDIMFYHDFLYLCYTYHFYFYAVVCLVMLTRAAPFFPSLFYIVSLEWNGPKSLKISLLHHQFLYSLQINRKKCLLDIGVTCKPKDKLVPFFILYFGSLHIL